MFYSWIIIMKKIWKLFIFLVAALSFIRVTFWLNCDPYCNEVQPRYQEYHRCEKECKEECRWDPDPDCKDDCVNDQCRYYYDNRQYFAYECHNCNAWTNSWENNSWTNSTIDERRNRCPWIDSSAINENTIAYIIEQDGHCCFETIDSPFNCNNWGIANTIDERRDRCPWIDSSDINEDTIAYIVEQDGHCCFETIDSPFNCANWWIIPRMQEACPDIADLITADSVDYVEKIDDFCCFDGWWYAPTCPEESENSICCPSWSYYSNDSCCSNGDCTPLPDECDSIKQLNTECQNITVNYDNYNYLDTNGTCCFDGWWYEPECEACSNPPQDGQCESWYRINEEFTCCIEMSCEEINSWDKQKCDERRGKWEAVKWENCSCVCDPAKWCCGVQLNVPLPFIGDCIELTTSNSTAGARDGSISINQLNAFPVLIKWISKIIVTLIMIFSVIVVIFAWVMMTTSVANESNYKTWLDMLKKVIIALILLWTSWLILKLINPTFFWG